jgi:hypothetical protein
LPDDFFGAFGAGSKEDIAVGLYSVYNGLGDTGINQEETR